MSKLNPTNPNTGTTGGTNAPFFITMMTSSTGSFLQPINYFGDYTSNPRYGYHQFKKDALIYNIDFVAFDGSILLAQRLTGRWNNSGTIISPFDGINVLDANYNVVQDLTKTSQWTKVDDVVALGSSIGVLYETWSATGANNDYVQKINIDFVDKFGSPLFVQEGHLIAVQLNQNFDNGWKLAVSGHYL